MYSIRVISSFEEFQKLKDQWFDLWSNALFRTPYQQWEWVYNSIAHDNDVVSPYIILVEDHCSLIGIAPFVKKSYFFAEIISFAGQDVTSYPDFIIHKSADLCIIKQIFEFIQSSLRCDALELRITEPSPFLAQWRSAIVQDDCWAVVKEEAYTKRLRINIGEDFDAYFATLSKEMRYDIRAANRKLESKYDVSFSVSDLSTDFDEVMDDLLRLYSLKWGAGDFSLYKDYYRALHDDGRMKFFILKCDNKVVGIVAGSLVDDTVYIELTGFDYSILKIDIGKAFYSKLMPWCVENRYMYMDFMTGDQTYKFRYKPHVFMKWKINLYKSRYWYLYILLIRTFMFQCREIRRKIVKSAYSQRTVLNDLFIYLRSKITRYEQ